MSQTIEQIKEDLQQLKKWRHDFHQHPELSFKESRTAKKIVEYLRQMGIDEVHEGIGKTGIVAVIRNGDGPSIAFRADMDALPVTETAPHNYTSENDGVMHACGHDGHVVMLLGAAKYLIEHRPFKGSVVLIFQPAEETIAGAPAMLKDGLLQRFPFESIYTLHSWPGASVNSMFVNSGPVMASVNNFDIKIKTSGGHAAMPQLTGDPIVAGSEMVLALQTLVSRKADPQDALVISFTVMHGGSVYNVIPNEVLIKGTARYHSANVHQWLPNKMRQMIDGIARIHDVSASFDFIPLCPITTNTKREAELAQSVISELLGDNLKGKEKPISMGSDDFCFYLEEVPGAYVYIGNGEDSASLHHSKYDFNDDALAVGAAFYVEMVKKNQAA